MSRLRLVVASGVVILALGIMALIVRAFTTPADDQLALLAIAATGAGLGALSVALLAAQRGSRRADRSNVASHKLLRDRTKRLVDSTAAVRGAQLDLMRRIDLFEATLTERTATTLASELDIRHLETLRAYELLEEQVAALDRQVAGTRERLLESLTRQDAEIAEVGDRVFESLTRQGAEIAEVGDRMSVQVRLAESRLEAVTRICTSLPLRRPLPPFGDWALDPILAYQLVDLVLTRKPHTIVEMGSGLSTVLVGYALEAIGGGRLVALEHDEHYEQRTRADLESHALTKWSNVTLAPLVETDLDGDTFRWYSLANLDLPDEIDMLIVDGPPGSINMHARYPALPILHDRLASGAMVLLDDGVRPDEAETINRWVKEFPEFSVTELESEKGARLLTREQ